MTDNLVVHAAEALPEEQRAAVLIELRNWLQERADTNADPEPAHIQTLAEGARRIAAGDDTGLVWLACAEAMHLREATADLEALLEGQHD